MNRKGESKLDWTFFPWFAMRGACRVFVWGGSKKHKPFGWRGVDNGIHQYMAAAMRHLDEITMSIAMHDGDVAAALSSAKDSESPELSVDHLLCDLAILRALMELSKASASKPPCAP